VRHFGAVIRKDSRMRFGTMDPSTPARSPKPVMPGPSPARTGDCLDFCRRSTTGGCQTHSAIGSEEADAAGAPGPSLQGKCPRDGPVRLRGARSIRADRMTVHHELGSGERNALPRGGGEIPRQIP